MYSLKKCFFFLFFWSILDNANFFVGLAIKMLTCINKFGGYTQIDSFLWKKILSNYRQCNHINLFNILKYNVLPVAFIQVLGSYPNWLWAWIEAQIWAQIKNPGGRSTPPMTTPTFDGQANVWPRIVCYDWPPWIGPGARVEGIYHELSK